MSYPPSCFLFQLEQACSTCLILACSRIAADQQVCNTVLDLFFVIHWCFYESLKTNLFTKILQVATWATMAFFMYGGEPQLSFTGSAMGTDGRMMPSNLGAMGISFWFLQKNNYQQIITIELISLLSTILKSNDFSGLCACPYWNFQACLFIFRAQSCNWIGHICDLNLGFALKLIASRQMATKNISAWVILKILSK